MTDTSWNRATTSRGEFRVGRVLSGALTLLKQYGVLLVAIRALCVLPTFVVQIDSLTAQFGYTVGIGRILALGGATPILQLLGGVLSIIGQALIIHYSFQKMQNQPVSIGESLGVAGGRFFPIIGYAILLGLAVVIGCMLLLVPGVILLLMWSVAGEACVVERLGPIKSLRRSAFLTKGHRWKLLGLFLCVLLIVMLAGSIMGGVIAILAYFGKLAPIYIAALAVIALLIYQTVVEVGGVMVAVVAYRDLRAVKEGIATDRVAAVFD